ncbi:transposase [metagenome]|uniref:Transposase n=1 Tax=metagenome TaxID=256318 RepID=A0A2P2CC96_9ZZZZ
MATEKFSKRMRVDLVQAMWEVYFATSNGPAAAAAVGIDRGTARNWIVAAGGIRPRQGRDLKGRSLTFQERQAIEAGLAVSETQVSIARRIGRNPGTVSREIARGRLASGMYSATNGQAVARDNASRSKACKLAPGTALHDRVQVDLQLRYSPEQIAGRLRRDFPDDPEMWVHHETIYQALYIQSRGALKRDLTAGLRTGRIRRKPHRKTGERRGRIPDMVMIAERPEEVAERLVPGHWEGDLIIGKNSGSAIGTLVERTTNYTILLHLPDNHGTDAVTTALVAAMSELPDQLRRSVTWDQGKEMARHQDVAIAADLDVYFCDPHSPWQRPVNENTNGLLRQYFPKGTDLSIHSPDDLAWVAHELNDRPRKRLDYARPSELITELLLQ